MIVTTTRYLKSVASWIGLFLNFHDRPCRMIVLLPFYVSDGGYNASSREFLCWNFFSEWWGCSSRVRKLALMGVSSERWSWTMVSLWLKAGNIVIVRALGFGLTVATWKFYERSHPIFGVFVWRFAWCLEKEYKPQYLSSRYLRILSLVAHCKFCYWVPVPCRGFVEGHLDVSMTFLGLSDSPVFWCLSWFTLAIVHPVSCRDMKSCALFLVGNHYRWPIMRYGFSYCFPIWPVISSNIWLA